MSEWWTYGPRDLLMFSADTYTRLFERYNADLWPLHVLAFVLGILVILMARRGDDKAGRAIAVILAVCWLWVGWGFLWQRYATINWAAPYFAVAFVIQALLLIWVGAVRARLMPVSRNRWQWRGGLSLFGLALLVFPLIGPLSGRSWAAVDMFGMTPDATAVATLGMLVFSGRQGTWMLLPIPVLWCLISGTTLWSMDAPDFAVVPLVALLAIGLRVFLNARGA